MDEHIMNEVTRSKFVSPPRINRDKTFSQSKESQITHTPPSTPPITPTESDETTSIVPRDKAIQEKKSVSPLTLYKRHDAIRWKHQESVNLMNYVFNCNNLVNVAKVSQRCRKLAAELDKGKKIVISLTNDVRHNSEKMQDLNEEIKGMDRKVQEQKHQVSGLCEKMSTQQLYMHDCIEEIKQQMIEQDQVLRRQEEELLELAKGKYNNDVAVDVAVLILGVMLSKNPLIRWGLSIGTYPIWLFTTYGFRKKYKNAVEKIAEWFLMFLMLNSCRVWAMHHGFHNAVGSYPKYIKHISKIIRSAIFGSLSNKSKNYEVEA